MKLYFFPFTYGKRKEITQCSNIMRTLIFPDYIINKKVKHKEIDIKGFTIQSCIAYRIINTRKTQNPDSVFYPPFTRGVYSFFFSSADLIACCSLLLSTALELSALFSIAAEYPNSLTRVGSIL